MPMLHTVSVVVNANVAIVIMVNAYVTFVIVVNAYVAFVIVVNAYVACSFSCGGCHGCMQLQYISCDALGPARIVLQ